jgi:hypothetical protein
MARRLLNPSKEQYWRRLLHQWRNSGLSIRAFCHDRSVSEPSFYAWRRTLAERDAATPPPASAAPRRATALFAPVRLIDAAPVAATGPPADTPPALLEVLCRGGRIVRVPTGYDPAAVRALVAALEELPC